MPHSVSLISTIAVGLGLSLVLGFLATRLRLPARARELALCALALWPRLKSAVPAQVR